MRTYIILLSILVVALNSCKKEVLNQTSQTKKKKNQTITINGTINNYSEHTILLKNYTKRSIDFEEETYELKLNDNSQFAFTFEADQPAYYRIHRNYLYLCPGDSIIMHLDFDDRSLATFQGKGAEANDYLKLLPYPKGGSFWGDIMYTNNKYDFEKLKTLNYKNVVPLFDSIYTQRHKSITSLKNTSILFKSLEKNRLNFEYINSLESVYRLYTDNNKPLSRDKLNELYDKAIAYYHPFIKEKLKNYNTIDNLQFEVFSGGILYSINDPEYRNKYQLPELKQELKDYILADSFLQELNTKYTSSFEEENQEKLNNLYKSKYSEIIKSKLKKYNFIKKGEPAIDVTFVNLNNQIVKLSDFKGKMIVLDLWATWCGPCLEEKPFFESLSKKYKDIVFLSVSIDELSVWKKYCEENNLSGTNELQINRKDLSDYLIEGIPRFFLFDNDFKIVDVFAPLPSTGELEKLILKNL